MADVDCSPSGSKWKSLLNWNRQRITDPAAWRRICTSSLVWKAAHREKGFCSGRSWAHEPSTAVPEQRPKDVFQYLLERSKVASRNICAMKTCAACLHGIIIPLQWVQQQWHRTGELDLWNLQVFFKKNLYKSTENNSQCRIDGLTDKLLLDFQSAV